MSRYIIIELKNKKKLKVSYIYYGNIISGLRVSKTVGIRHKYFKYVERIFTNIQKLIRDELKSETVNIRKILRRNR